MLQPIGAPEELPLDRPARALPWGTITLFIGIVSAIFRIVESHWVPSPHIFDELFYSKLAGSLLHFHTMLMHGSYLDFPAILYCFFLAPLKAIANPWICYRAMQALNAVLITSAAIPIYLLARDWMGRAWASAASVLTMLSPNLLYSNVIMAENLLFPLAAWSAYLTIRAVEDPRWRFKLALGGVLGLDFLTKRQGIFFPIASLAALGMGMVGSTGALKARLKRVAPWMFTALVFIAFMALRALWLKFSFQLAPHAAAAVAGSFDSVLGNVSTSYFTPKLLIRALGANFSAWTFTLGFLPVAGFGIFAYKSFQGGQARERVFAVYTFALAAIFLLAASRQGLVDSDPTAIYERYTFYVEPLLLMGALRACQLGWLSRRAVLPLALGLVLMVAFFIPQSAGNLSSDAFGFAALKLPNAWLGLHKMRLLALFACGIFAFALAELALRARWRGALALLVTYNLALTALALVAQHLGSAGYAQALPFTRWLDSQAGTRAPIALVLDGQSPTKSFEADFLGDRPLKEFYLKTHAYRMSSFEEPLKVSQNGELQKLSALQDGSWIVSDASVALHLPIVSQESGDVLYRKQEKVNLDWQSETKGLDANHWTNGHFIYSALPRESNRLQGCLELALDTHGIPARLGPYVVTLDDGMGDRQTYHLPLNKAQTLQFVVRRRLGKPFLVMLDSATWNPGAEKAPGFSADETAPHGIFVAWTALRLF